MVGECKCHTNKLTIRIERSGKYVVRGGRIKDKKIIHARVCECSYQYQYEYAIITRKLSMLSGRVLTTMSCIMVYIATVNYFEPYMQWYNVMHRYGMFVCITYSASLHVCTLLYML
jgi:hypothetical protein